MFVMLSYQRKYQDVWPSGVTRVANLIRQFSGIHCFIYGKLSTFFGLLANTFILKVIYEGYQQVLILGHFVHADSTMLHTCPTDYMYDHIADCNCSVTTRCWRDIPQWVSRIDKTEYRVVIKFLVLVGKSAKQFEERLTVVYGEPFSSSATIKRWVKNDCCYGVLVKGLICLLPSIGNEWLAKKAKQVCGIGRRLC